MLVTGADTARAATNFHNSDPTLSRFADGDVATHWTRHLHSYSGINQLGIRQADPRLPPIVYATLLTAPAERMVHD